MMGFHSLHASEVGLFIDELKTKGFKRKAAGQWELHRLEHEEKGKVVIYSKKTGNPFPKLNDNGYKLFQELRAGA